MITWLPDPPEQGETPALSENNIEHIAAAAAAVQNLLLAGEARLAYALCRPPGHHAGRDFMGGYCYLNNAAVAAAHLAAAWGRVGLLDVDYHHGNGTQDIFWDDPQVFFGSIHAAPGVDYPYYSGYADETGGPTAPGGIANVPLGSGTTSADYLAALDGLLARCADFGAAALVVSLGFDAYAGDPMSIFDVQPETYTAIGERLAGLGVPVLLVQEGGYQVEALGRLAGHLLAGLGSAQAR
ncbi:MAG: hypothetical protein HC929_12750 [Leptolyngbyaceae cyanobacterium SM2_5_2]|nr:hypothetical protein [Leptolyngbyaceae cyanobacterium SM2_5_2]